jgi:vacuolar-type H+-ATPase subunit F/Vma7
MADAFVIAEEELVLAFRLVGVPGRAVAGRDEALDAFRRATSQRTAAGEDGAGSRILILTEDLAELLAEEAKEWQLSGEYPLIVEIPGQGRRRSGRKGLMDAVREAIGVSV